MRERYSNDRQQGRVGIGLAAAVLMTAGSAMAQTPAAAPTYTKDVAPIFQEKCQSCHRPGQMGPMSLLTYEEARPWARFCTSR